MKNNSLTKVCRDDEPEYTDSFGLIVKIETSVGRLGFNRLPHDSRYLAKIYALFARVFKFYGDERVPPNFKNIKTKIQVTDIPKINNYRPCPLVL